MTKEFAKSTLAIPTTSGHEGMMVEYIEKWCQDNGVRCQRDGKKNLYLTKGHSDFFPCVTSHMDTVHHDQQEYIDRHEMLPVEEDGDKLWIPNGPNGQQTGVGADCKAGIAVCLSIVAAQPNIKACFFVEEEVGMKGSRSLDEHWFSDVAYVIGFDSPEHNRAAKSCSGTLLFDDKFFEDNIEAVASQHGVTNFRHEPYTDVLNIRKKTEIACMNFGNGGWHPHSPTEYALFSQMCQAEQLGNSLVNTIPLDKQYKVPVGNTAQSWQHPSVSLWHGALSQWRQPAHQPQSSGQMSLAQYAEMKGKEKLRREGLLKPTEPTDDELDAIEVEYEDSSNQGLDDLDDFFEWLESRK